MNKVFGLSYVRVENGSWNNSFEGVPRADFDGVFFATDKARKYSIRQDLLNDGNKVLIRKHKATDGKFQSLNNILKSYGLDEKNGNDRIFEEFIDVRLFGAIVNPSNKGEAKVDEDELDDVLENIDKKSKSNKSINLATTGPVQLLFAKNQLVKDGERSNESEMIDITSYKSSGTTDETMTTIGKQCRTEKAYYMYPIVVNPNVYMKNAEEILGDKFNKEKIEALYESDIIALKNSMKYDVSELNSCSKMGCTNFVNIFITMKDNLAKINMSSLQDNLFIEENEIVDSSKIEVTINLENLYSDLVLKKDLIEKIEIHVPSTSRFVIKGLEKLNELGVEIITERI